MRPSLIATLAVGLPESSRIVRKYSKTKLTIEQMLLAMLVDGIFKKLTEENKPKDELMSFRTPEEFEAWMARKREKQSNG